MRKHRTTIAVGASLLLLSLASLLTDDSIEASGVTLGDVVHLRGSEYDYEVLVSIETDDVDELLDQEQLIGEPPIAGVYYLLFRSLDCIAEGVHPLGLEPGSRLWFRHDPTILMSEPAKLQAAGQVVADCSPIQSG